MAMIWNDTTARWYTDASDYTHYSRRLAELLLPYIIPGGTLCDLGCGLSLTDLELARHVRGVTCVDESEYAVAYTRRRAAELGLGNVTALCRDARLTEGVFDTVMCLFHGNMEQYVHTYLPLAKGRFLAVIHDDPDELVAQPEKYRVRKLTSVRQMSRYLDSLGIRHSVQRGCLEFGQPLRDSDDAVRYVEFYEKPEAGETAREYLMRCAVPADHGPFELYLPLQRRFAVFSIDC